MLSKNISNRTVGVPAAPLDFYDQFNGEDEDYVPIPDRTNALVRGLDLILEHHNASNFVRAELTAQLHAHLDTSFDEMVWLKKAKFLLTYPLSKYLRNELPPAPDNKFVAKGALRKWMKQRICCFNRKNTHLWYSWLQAKRSALPVSDSIVDATYEKHLETLTRKDPGDDLTIQEIFSDRTFIRLLDQVRGDVGRQFMFPDDNKFDETSPSNSACFEVTRGGGGQQGELLVLSGLCEKDKKGRIIPFYDHFKELHSMRFDPVVVTGYGRRFNIATEVRIDYGVDEWKSLRLRYDALTRGNICCTIQAVLEPMKVRVISKGEALQYYSCKPLQKALHTALRNIPCFRLIGRPLSPTDLIDLKKNADMWDKWFSIDYSAATDGLSWKYAGQILRYIIQDIPAHMRDVALDVLGPHALHYPIPGSPGCRTFKGIQQNGQLMGSILSFPILCLANLGVYLLTTQAKQRKWSYDMRLNHVLINGDDMVYAANDSLWDHHVRIAAHVGLEMSVGKAYRHHEYVNINSMSLHYSLSDEKATPWQIDYLNTGLFFGQHKVQNKKDGYLRESDKEIKERDDVSAYLRQSDILKPGVYYGKKASLGPDQSNAHMSADPSRGLAVNLNTILQGSWSGKQHELLSKFLIHHHEALREECKGSISHRGKINIFTRNLFIPVSLGGLGVIPPPGWRYRVKPIHLQVAQQFMLMRNHEVATCYPLPGYPVEDIESVVTVPWVKKEASDTPFLSKYMSIKATKYFAKSGIIPYADNKCVVHSKNMKPLSERISNLPSTEDIWSQCRAQESGWDIKTVGIRLCG